MQGTCEMCRKFKSKDVGSGRFYCKDHPRECWCPCSCGCREPHLQVNSSGLCPDCEEGNHEVPPHMGSWEEKRGIIGLLRLHEEIIAQ